MAASGTIMQTFCNRMLFVFCAALLCTALAAAGATPAIESSGGALDLLPHAATLQANLTQGGTADVSVHWGTADGGTNGSRWERFQSLGTVSEGGIGTRLINLQPQQCYYYRFHATNESGEAWTGQLHFATPNAWIRSIAHRGETLQVPENTLAAFRYAKGRSDWVEFDVRQTADEALVIMHDDAINRTTDATGRVVNLTVSQLRSCSAGYPALFGTAFADERIPTLGEALATIAPDATPLLDCKAGSPAVFIREIRASGLARSVIVSSYTLPFLVEVHRLAPEISLGILGTSADLPALLPTLKTNGISHVFWDSMPPEQIALVHKNSLLAYAFTIDSTSAMQALIQGGIDGIITDLPETVTRLAQEDMDGDQLPDAWELRFAADAGTLSGNDDHDGDGLTDWEEYRAGTNPLHALSLLALSDVHVTDMNHAELKWPSVAGQFYEVFTRRYLSTSWTSLAGGIGSTAPDNVCTVRVDDAHSAMFQLRTQR
jgi:glycerophosphoryl diester phosphodiesterase